MLVHPLYVDSLLTLSLESDPSSAFVLDGALIQDMWPVCLSALESCHGALHLA